MTIEARQRFTTSNVFALSAALVLLTGQVAQAKSKYACDQEQPATMCTEANTCGSASAPCMVDIRRGAYSANAKPNVPDAKSNQFFCIKTGTTVIWMSSGKSYGFSVSFGTDSPFDPDAPIMGGGKKQVTTKASTPGCYKYDVGAFRSGTVYGMSSGSKPELVILP